MSDKPKKEKKAKKEKQPKNNKVKICPACQAEIPKKAKVCPRCAAPQKKKSPLPLIILLVVVLLVGAAVSVFIFHFPIDPPVELPFETPFGKPKYTDTVLGQGMELTAKQEEAMVDIFTQCGFKEITQVTRMNADSTTTSYAVKDRDIERFMASEEPFVVRVENETKTVRSILYQSHPIYANEEVVGQATDYYMDMAERDVYMAAAVDAVKARLDLPELAVFPSRSHWSYYEDGNILIVSSSVTTKDGTGKETIRPFLARFEDASLVSITFEDTNS